MADKWGARRVRAARALGVDLTHAQQQYARMLDGYVAPGSTWLEIGCGHQILPDWAMRDADQRTMVARCRFVAGIDIDEGMKAHPLLTYRAWAVGERLPFRNATFTLVTANMVVEHLADPASVLAEINRVLRTGGHFLFHTVNQRSLMRLAAFMPDSVKVKLAWVLERRVPEDVFPTHYRMNTEPQIADLARQTGFAVERLEFPTMVGLLPQLGPVGIAELPMIKIMQHARMRRFGMNVMAAFRKTSLPER